MEEKIKREVIAYKGMKYDMTCKGFHYELGKSYKTDKAELCNCGFHACLNPIDVLEYYFEEEGSRYFKVKLSGEITKCDEFDTEVSATEMTILEEINIDECIKTTEWWKNENVLDLLYFSDGLAQIRNCDSQYNFIDKQGKLLSEQWFEWVDIFHDGLARVRREDNLYNLIDKNGNYLFDEWFMYVDNFYDGFAEVQREDGKYNFITANGKLLSEQWFEWIGSFYNGFALVERENHQYNFIDRQGKLLSEEWFRWVNYFDEYGLAVVERTNGEQCKIDKTGNLIKD